MLSCWSRIFVEADSVRKGKYRSKVYFTSTSKLKAELLRISRHSVIKLTLVGATKETDAAITKVVSRGICRGAEAANLVAKVFLPSALI